MAHKPSFFVLDSFAPDSFTSVFWRTRSDVASGRVSILFGFIVDNQYLCAPKFCQYTTMKKAKYEAPKAKLFAVVQEKCLCTSPPVSVGFTGISSEEDI